MIGQWHRRKVCHVKILPHVASPSSKIEGSQKMPNNRIPTSWSKTWVSPLVSAWEALIGWPYTEWPMVMESAESSALLSYVDISQHSLRNRDISQKADWMQLCWRRSSKLSCCSNLQVYYCGLLAPVLQLQQSHQRALWWQTVGIADVFWKSRAQPRSFPQTTMCRTRRQRNCDGCWQRVATTRAFGDAWAKQQGPPENHIITAMPEVRSIARHPGQHHLVLASDGVYGFMSSQDVVSLCVSTASKLSPVAPLSGISHAIVCTAVARRSDDNCTCLVVDLPRVDGKPNAPAPPPWPKEIETRLEAAPDPANAFQAARGKMWVANGAPPAPKMGDEDSFLPRTRPTRPRRSGDELVHSNGIRPKEVVKEDSDRTSIPSSTAAPEEVCWCPWCWGMNQEGEAENRLLGSFEQWRLHMHEHHFDRLAVAYAGDEIVPCYWCCRPCVTKKGQHKSSNRLPFWGSHERVCRENPSKPVLPGQARSSEGSQTSSGECHWRRSQVPQRHRKEVNGGVISPDFRDLRDSNDLRELRRFSLPGDEALRMGYESQPPVQHRTSTGSDRHPNSQGHRRPQAQQVQPEMPTRDGGSRRQRAL
ncbi:unnamed protein product [Cladocopium goreaui]|uniref:PPM-type phosphatase domain-containing protein n=1 Tax=Cladocopium goreaui TaxID=2562237 RepID=A0A9P1DI13_9DINO|nr:unnamed protein product [Cladocopium goreaui]